MQIGIVGLGRMGLNIAIRLSAAGHECVVFDHDPAAVAAAVAGGAKGAADPAAMVTKLESPRIVWLMVPAAAVDGAIDGLVPLLAAGDIVVDGGNSNYHDDLRRAHAVETLGLHYVDVGVSGGVWGRARGFCHMIGGEDAIVRHLDPIFRSLAPGVAAAARTPGAVGEPGNAELGYLHCGPTGAGHFVKMVHNGIEYGMMAALAEGLNVLRHANAGAANHAADAETAPLRHPELYRYDFDIAAIAEMWRRGSVVSSWLLDLAAAALLKSPGLDGFAGRVSDSGEGRWTLQAAIDEGVPAPVLATALFGRFESRGESDYADRVLSALRFGFGGHLEKPAAAPAQH
ncbi:MULTISPECIES: phosphogluconate dehydrogenase (NAD(+)-dependent, decarboxylating) [Sphingosinicellaceae]|uniref:phosphogluconate dehydrogenase (NAD(+)-dependent, decarboxylating) n=1 Tax=Sphingosinicellaceae TaxID=2820280 RepID=UPI001C1DD657|nr:MULTISPECIES: decarboxylating 6-phosphogluconate dehydrogenase [Polymorphobacter]QYE33510.1 decarboxylating 6-phosphogluconate dehydrogenase [Polymorphobacter sp. PAMC 29334]UAJ12873.1 decarboxylating 6-phosphogluconate dehydrogenase [Polymorphobacter megasporae]